MVVTLNMQYIYVLLDFIHDISYINRVVMYSTLGTQYKALIYYM